MAAFGTSNVSNVKHNDINDLFGDSESVTDEVVNSPIAEIRDAGSEIGGNRAVYARKFIPAGSLILLEWPSFVWQPEQLVDEDELFSLLVQMKADEVASRVFADLHPKHLTDVHIKEIDDARSIFGDKLLSLVASEQNEFIRIYLAFKHNGFRSGLYHALCMINHSCVANSIKFEPRKGSRGASEVWSTRDIQANEEITINYLSPAASCYANAQKYLSLEHSFICSCQRCLSISAMIIPLRLETATAWEEDIERCETELQSALAIADMMDLPTMTDEFEQGSHAIQPLLAVIATANMDEVYFTDKVRLLIRGYNALCGLSRALLQTVNEAALDTLTEYHKTLFLRATRMLLPSAISLVTLQIQLYDKDHPDLITSWEDVATGFQVLLKALKLSEADITLQLEDVDIDILRRHFAIADHIELSWRAFCAMVEKEVQRLKKLYSLPWRCPQATKVLPGSGVTFWSVSVTE